MTYQRLAYDDASTASEMTSDCRAVEATLELPQRRTLAERAARAAARPAPSLLFADYPSEIAKQDIAVGEAASRLAAAYYQD